jgi:hypothetical protein
MKKVWLGLLVGLLPLALACGSTSSAQDNGGGASNGAGGGTVPLPEYSYDVPCDESKIVNQWKSYSTESVDGETVRGALRSTYTQTLYYSWTEVENPLDAVIFSCDYTNETTPDPLEQYNPSFEYIVQNGYPRGECSINHGAQATGNRVLTSCTTISELVYNKNNPAYDSSEEIDSVSETGYQRVRITGTRVTE